MKVLGKNNLIVIGLGYGDEGKGITTDFLAKQSNNSVVIRFSGGQQAGHTVIVDGLKHTFSSFGSGTLRGIPTYISEYCTVYPVSLVNEAKVLKDKGINPKIFFHPFAKITTPMDVYFNRSFQYRNGTCGLGVGSTMKRTKEMYGLRVIDLLYPEMFKEKYNLIKSVYYKNRMEYFDSLHKKEEEYFFNNLQYLDSSKIIGYEKLLEFDNRIFEGSQGILLDKTHGLFPNVTYANTTSKNVITLINSLGENNNTEVFYVTRSYQTRHGKGWMSESAPISLINNQEEINVYNEYQGDFKISELDYNLLNYSLFVDNTYLFKLNNAVEKRLVVTCLDQRPDFVFNKSLLPDDVKIIFGSYGPDSNKFKLL